VDVLVAHEPPVVQLLPEPDRVRAGEAQKEVEDTFRTEGAMAALRKFAALSGIDLGHREPGVTLAPPNPDRLPNLEFFLTYDAPAVRDQRLDLDALKASPTRIVPAVGETSAHAWPQRCGRLLAEALGLPYAEFPGGHNGNVMHPKAFAARLLEVLNA
jgi:hypothetical protein